jgi:collagenase-like PrtC family protease
MGAEHMSGGGNGRPEKAERMSGGGGEGIKICVPSRFEPELLDGLEPLQAETGRIHEVYGSLSRSIVGSGRPARRLVQHGGTPTFEHVREFTERAHGMGIRVNYLLNAATLNMSEYTAAGRREIVEYVAEVADTGVDMVTIAVPYLIELVRAEFPELPVSVSVICEVDTTHELRLWERHGVQRVQLAEECNRDMALLEQLTKAATVDLSLVVNNGCLRFCPYRNYHNTLCTQGSQSERPAHGYIDYPLLKCSAIRALEPVEILRSPWVRPEDVKYYHEKFGIELFKIAGRQLTLENILNMASAYARGAYEGNFMDLLATPTVDFSSHPMTAALAAERGPERYRRPPIYIDNARLGKLTRALHARGGCGGTRDCDECGLCDAMMGGVIVEDDSAARAEHAQALQGLIGELVEGSWSAA